MAGGGMPVESALTSAVHVYIERKATVVIEGNYVSALLG